MEEGKIVAVAVGCMYSVQNSVAKKRATEDGVAVTEVA